MCCRTGLAWKGDLYLFKDLLFLAVLGLCSCVWPSPGASSGSYSLAAVRGLLTAAASPVVEHRL